MFKIKLATIALFLCCFTLNADAQTIDSTKKITTFSGSLGVTNNGFSIVPSFSLNSPAVIILPTWRKGKFSIEPDIRLTLDAKRGGMLCWFRYHAIQKEKFSFRTGFHPAMNIQTRQIATNGDTSQINQMRRFLAWELAPNYKINKNLSVGLFYLQGNGLQKDGPQTSHFVSLNTVISNIKLGEKAKFMFVPSVFYLYLDGYEGAYFSAAAILSSTKFPITFSSAINKTIMSNLPGNKDFLWNIGLNYVFHRKLARLK